MKMLYKIAAPLVLVISFAGFAASQTEREKGVGLFKQGKTKEAIAILEKAGKQKQYQDDAEIFNYLGLAYAKNNDLKRARKNLEKAVNINQQNADYRTNLAYIYLLADKMNEAQRESTKAVELNPRKADAFYVRGTAYLREGKFDEAIADADKATAVDANYASAYLLKSDALLLNFGKRIAESGKPVDELDLLKQSKNALEYCLKNCSDKTQNAMQTERLSGVQAFYDYFIRRRDAPLFTPGAPPAPPDPNGIKITAKPHAAYTDRARQAGISGTIRLAVLFSETGRVTHTLVLKGLDSSLNQQAIQAASGIKFEPAKENGKPISVVKIIEYTFTIY